MEKIVISAINLDSGGTLKIAYNYLDSICACKLYEKYEFIFLVHKTELYNSYKNHIKFIEYPKSKKSWLFRIYYEYIYFSKLSNKLKPYIWLSLHDITPNVKAKVRIVYCHNSTPFFKLKPQDIRFDIKVTLFTIFYKYLYRINIHKNDYIIVQQKWLRDTFSDIYNINRDKIVVAYASKSEINKNNEALYLNRVHRFSYPSLSRQFKNFEVVCRAVEILLSQGITDFTVRLTLDGSENSYAKWVYNKYKHLKNIDFHGLVPMDKMPEFYENTDCLIFASRLETWGLPISEFKSYNRPMILADLPYAHETSSGTNNICFFKHDDPDDLANYMKKLISGDFSEMVINENNIIEKPFVTDFDGLFNLILMKADTK